MPAIIAIAVAVIIGIAVVSFALHLLFSPWLLLVAVGVFAWIATIWNGRPVFTTAFMLFPGHQRVVAATTIGALATLAPTIGPVIGGYITDAWSWHWLFYLNLVPGIAVTLLVPRYVNFDTADVSLLKKGDYVVFESTVYPGCTEEDCLPVIESLSGLKNGRFFAASRIPAANFRRRRYGLSPPRRGCDVG